MPLTSGPLGAARHSCAPWLFVRVPRQTPVAVLPGDTADSLAGRVLIAEHQLYSRMLAKLVTRETTPEWLFDQVRTRALDLPEAEETTSHGSPAWRVKGGKYFAYFTKQYHGEPYIALLAKTSGPDEMANLVETYPEAYFRPAYYGASGWVGVILNRPGLDWDTVAEWLERSWRAVAPKRLTRLMDVADGF